MQKHQFLVFEATPLHHDERTGKRGRDELLLPAHTPHEESAVSARRGQQVSVDFAPCDAVDGLFMSSNDVVNGEGPQVEDVDGESRAVGEEVASARDNEAVPVLTAGRTETLGNSYYLPQHLCSPS